MRLTKTTAVWATLTVLALGCRNSSENKSATASADEHNYEMNDTRQDAADSSMVQIPETSLARMGLLDSIRKFVVKADLRFRVKDVMDATYDIESLVMKTGGFVTFTELRSDVEYTTVTEVSPDSSLEATHYTVKNDMVIRVPKTQLDTFLRGVGRLVDFFDYRIIKADDVGLGLLENTLAQRRLAEYDKRQKKNIDNAGKDLFDVNNAEENRLNKQQQSDEAMVQNLRTEDEVKYSTVSLHFYQRGEVSHTLIANTKNIKRYESGFGQKLIKALEFGWEMLQYFVLFLARIWTLIVLLIAAIVLYRRVFRKPGKKGNESQT